jgi:hypothetical protein
VSIRFDGATTWRITVGLKRKDVIHEAKMIVLSSGPSNVLEFGDEIVRDAALGSTATGEGWSNEDSALILAEAVRQAQRVYDFLGYAPRGA